jgi:hypothetical protein
MRSKGIAIAGAALALVGCGSTGRSTTSTYTKTVTFTTTNAPAAPTSPASTAYTTIPGEGTFRVGADVQPGTYLSSAAEADRHCYWYRLRDLSGTPSGQIASGYTLGPVYVTISSTDAAFKTEGCQTWQKVS